MPRLKIYTDGSCNPNPGKGGWAFISLDPSGEIWVSGGDDYTTNNIMEMTAVMEALKFYRKTTKFKIYTDSQYVINCATGKWLRKKNIELWKEFDALLKDKNVKWKWVKGHNGNKYNEQVDKLAKRESC